MFLPFRSCFAACDAFGFGLTRGAVAGEKFRGRPCRFFGVRDMCAREVCLCVSVRRRTIVLCARHVFHVVLSANKRTRKEIQGGRVDSLVCEHVRAGSCLECFREKTNNCFVCETCVSFCVVSQDKKEGEKFRGPCRLFGVRDMREVCIVCFSEKKKNCLCARHV